MSVKIPSSKPFLAGHELAYVAHAIAAGEIASDGFFTQQCARLLEERFAIGKVLMTPSCSAALEMAAMLCDLRPGDEVILPSFTFVSTASAIVRLGARPVFVDIRPDTLNLDERLVAAAITSRTKAIFAVHYGGIGCDMERLMAIAQAHGLMVVEDAAQGVNAFYRGRALGSIGHLGAYSFHYTKNYTCGEGGALCINSPAMVERAEIIREKGTNRTRFLRGEVEKYTWVEIGSSYIPSEIACAFLYAQLEELEQITARRQQVFQFYHDHLLPLAVEHRLRLPLTPEGCRSNYHLYYIILPDKTMRDALMAHLNRHGVAAVSHYVPLHSSPVGQTFGYQEGDLPVTEDLSQRLLRLPIFPDLTQEEQLHVLDQLVRFLQQMKVAARTPELFTAGVSG
jgi:dTDP-4-amino-4,6-dideoxygalactose transaminase